MRARGLAILLAPALTLPAAVQADDLSGRIELGYQDVSVDGDRSKFRQQVDLDDGVVLGDLLLRWERETAQGWAPTRAEASASGFGSARPYRQAGLRVGAPGRWRLRWDHRGSDYIYNDLLKRPEDTLTSRVDGGDFRHIDVERRHDRVTLQVSPLQRLTLVADGDWLRRDGESMLPYDISREEFELDAPVDQRHWRGGLTATWRMDSATLVVAGHRRDDEDDGLAFLPAPSGGSSAAPTALDSFVLDQPHRLQGDERRFGLHTHGAGPWRFGIDLLSTDIEVDADARETASGVAFNGQPLLDDLSYSGDLDRNTRLVRGRVAWHGGGGLVLRAVLEDRLLDQDALLIDNGNPLATAWRLEHRGAELGIALAPAPGLHIDAAVSSGRRRSTEQLSGSRELHVTREDGYRLQARWRPNERLSLHLLAEDRSVDDPYTLASATDAQRLRLTARWRWDNGLWLSAAARREDRSNSSSDWRADQRDLQLRMGWASPALDIAAGVARLDWSRDIDQTVVGGFRSDVFAIAWNAESTLVDASIAWRPRPRLEVSAALRVQDSDGSVPVERDDIELGADLDLGGGWGLGAGWRRIDHSEEDLEEFDADIIELRLRHAW